MSCLHSTFQQSVTYFVSRPLAKHHSSSPQQLLQGWHRHSLTTVSFFKVWKREYGTNVSGYFPHGAALDPFSYHFCLHSFGPQQWEFPDTGNAQTWISTLPRYKHVPHLLTEIEMHLWAHPKCSWLLNKSGLCEASERMFAVFSGVIEWERGAGSRLVWQQAVFMYCITEASARTPLWYVWALKHFIKSRCIFVTV